MRRRAAWRCCWRMRALTCGSPSLSLCSWRTSSLDMRSFFRWLQICQGTSSATITASEATISAQQMATMVSARVARRGRHVHEAQHVVVVTPDHPDRHAAHQQGLGQRLDQLDHRLRGKHALEAGERAELGQIVAAACPRSRSRPAPRWTAPRSRPAGRRSATGSSAPGRSPCTACSTITPGSSGTRWSKARPLRSTRSGPGTASRRRARSPRRRRPAS